MTKRHLLFIVLPAVVLTGGYLFAQSQFARSEPTPVLEQPAPDAAEVPSPAAKEPAEPLEAPTVFYPTASYVSRITNRDHGKSTTLADSAGFACGGQFEGIHVGDDMEVSAEELSEEVPVFAIADGTVRQLRAVNGYGGLLIIEHVLNGQTVTAYYGHVDLNQAKFKPGDKVSAGKVVIYLGDSCSAETSNERKHLHFAIRKGTSIDVRGYIQNRSELAEWHDPTELLAGLKAAEPGQ